MEMLQHKLRKQRNTGADEVLLSHHTYMVTNSPGALDQK